MNIKAIPRLLPLCFAGIASLLVSGPSSRAQQPPAESSSSTPARPSGAISGRVINSGGEPLTGAIVYISTFGATSGRTAIVDAGGSFRIDGLDPLAYFVGASVPGFVSDTIPNEQRRFYHIGDSVTLTLTKGGVISGTVTSSTNTAVVNTIVRSFRVRDENGQPVQGVIQARERFTDDRGYYRMYGLQSGFYVISTGGAGRFGGFPNQYDSDAPTYAPSSTRDTATEIFVRGGDEVTADIQYRGEAGHSVSGTLAGLITTQATMFSGATIQLTDIRSRAVIMFVSASPQNNYAFAFYGVGDGEYEVFAQRYVPSGDSMASEARHIKVQGADVSGINLNLVPLASISGRLVLESSPKAECVKRRSTALQETVIGGRRIIQETKPTRPPAKTQTPTNEVPLTFANQNFESIPDMKGDFILRNLHNGLYRFATQFSENGWYLRAITMGTPPTVVKPSDPNIPRDGLTLKTGEKVSGLTVTITEGAASLRGHLVAAEGQRVPAGLRVYLVPAERDNAENVLRFFEAAADPSARFAIDNIAPGRYWLIVRSADEGDPAKVKPIRQEPVLRARVLREAESLKKEIAFKPCEQTSDYELPWTASIRP
jgi:hypothetical protein